jgi:GT2 family glycosyltransferase
VKSFPLAILLVFRNQKEIAEKTLTNIYSHLLPEFELYIVDDASDDDTRQTIQSVVEHFAHENTYFFENTTSLGREKCISELMQQVSTPFIWMPEHVEESLDELLIVARLLKSTPTAVIPDTDISVDAGVSGDKLRPDSMAAVWLVTDEEVKSVDEPNVPAPDKTETKVPVAKAPVKSTSVEPAKPQKAPVKLKSMYRMHSLVLPENASDAAREIFPKMDEFVQEGEYLYALKMVDAEQLKHPMDADLIRLKIKVLELMRRYVEAAELKHQLKLGGPGVARPKIRRESIIIVDPTEDYEGTAVVDQQEKRNFDYIELNKEKITDEAPVQNVDAEEHQLDEDFDDFDSGVIGVPKPMSVKQEESVVDEPFEDFDSGVIGVPKPMSVKPEESVEDEQINQPVTLNETESTESGEFVSNFELDETDETSEGITSEERIDQSDETDDLTNSTSEVAHVKSDAPPFLQPIDPSQKPAQKRVFDGKYSASPRISIIIPTTIDGKGLLERTVYSLSKHADGADRELIIVDNASLDDTYDYLKQLKKENFMQVRIVTNHENLGFARSVNQGIEIAKGEYVLILHNDVIIHDDIPGKLAEIMEAHPEITVLGPTAPVTMSDAQRTKVPDKDEKMVKKARFVDSFCMMLRKSKVGKFDEQYGLAYFDDMDYCLTDVKNGGVIGVAAGLSVDHLGGATTSAIGLEGFSRAYWKNASLFETKWNSLPALPDFAEDEDEIKNW